MSQVLFKRGLPKNLEEMFNDGRIAHIVLITRKLVDGEWQERHVVCMTPRHELVDAEGRKLPIGAEDQAGWDEVEGEPDEAGAGGYGEPSARAYAAVGAATDDAEPAISAPTGTTVMQLSTSYRKCVSDGQRCYLLTTSSGQTCRHIGGSANNLPLCND
jgi:hypothetical protein